jgi:predicted RNA methylase
VKIFNVEISEEVKAVLKAGRVAGSNYYLPGEQLERKMYLEVNKILELLGGKWNRSAKCHIFQDNIASQLKEALEEGKVIDKKKTYQFFETPEEVAMELINLAEILEGDDVLEPSAGHGAIAKYLPKGSTLIEVDNEKCAKLKALGFAPICQDFLTYTEKKFDRIIMNPPFTSGQDVSHILHAYSLLKKSGRVVAVAPSMITEKLQKKYRKVQSLISEVIDLPDCSFEESGTKVNTKIIILNKEG